MDLCYSGTAIDQLKAFLRSKGKVETESGDNNFGQVDTVHAFVGEGQIEFRLHTACASDEVAFDNGEAAGGSFTHEFLEKCIEPIHGYPLHPKDDNSKVQHCQGYKAIIKELVGAKEIFLQERKLKEE